MASKINSCNVKFCDACEWKVELPIARKTETDIRWKEKVGRF